MHDEGTQRWPNFHDAVVSADGAELFDEQGGIGAVLEGEAALTGHAIAASVERSALVILRFVHVKYVTKGAFARGKEGRTTNCWHVQSGNPLWCMYCSTPL